MAKEIDIKELLSDKSEELGLVLLAGKEGLERKITSFDVNRPGLALAGYTEVFHWKRIQIFGETEASYLTSLDQVTRLSSLNKMMSFEIPAMILAKEISPPDDLRNLSDERKIPLLGTSMKTTLFIHLLTQYLEERLSPEITIQGTLVDVYGVGVLLTGKAGIGKSECALSLVERGHRFVADDLVRISNRGGSVLIGRGFEKRELLRYHLEIRGIGIIDVPSIYGIHGVRKEKIVEIKVELIRWHDSKTVDLTGLEKETENILDVEIPFVKIPILPGKDVALLCEVAAKNYLLNLHGIDPAEKFNQELIRLMSRKKETRG
jgi:HPr kinase/phosphorylase